MRFPDSINIETARLVLSPLASDDAQAWFGIMSDPAVMRYWNHPAWTDIGQARAAIAADIEAREAGTTLKLGVRDKADRRLVGMCVLFAVEPESRRGEIGYCLASDAQGRGYMREALTGFVGFLLDDLGMRRLEAEIDPRNEASARVLERLSFRREGLLRKRWVVAGEVSDSALYGLLAEDCR